MTIKGMPISELLVLLVPALAVVFGLTRKDSTTKFLWLLAPIAIAGCAIVAWAYNTFGPTVGTDAHDPFRTYFVAAVLGLAAPLLAQKYRNGLVQQAEKENAE